MNKQQFLTLHQHYIESVRRTLDSTSIQEFVLRDKIPLPQSERVQEDIDLMDGRLTNQFQQVEKDILNLEKILNALKSGKILSEENRETFYAFALTLPGLCHLPGQDNKIMQIYEPYLYVPSFNYGILEPILVQGELTLDGSNPVREFRTVFYIDSKGDHKITSLLKRQQEADGSNVSIEIIADPFEVYSSVKEFKR